MKFSNNPASCCILASLVFWGQAFPLAAQDDLTVKDAARSTIVNFEILAGADGGALHSQAWRQIFEKWEVSFLVRRGRAEDKIDLTERTVGTLRYVTAIGQLGKTGDLLFPGRTFSRSDSAALKEWIDELKTYGIQGAPSGKPLWGLSKSQFEEVYAALSTPVEAEVLGVTVPVGIERLKLPTKFPLRWSAAAEKRYQSLGDPVTVRQELTGFTAATALAVMLNDRGFGFRPNRLPDGSIELLIDLHSEDPIDQWPIGWPIQKQTPHAVPGMFAFTNVELFDAPASAVLEAASQVTKTPILVDYAALDREGVSLDGLLLTHPLKKTTWSLALRAMLVPNKLNRDYWQDEAGRSFVWISTIGKPRAAVPALP